MLESPRKEMVIFEHSGHRPSFEEPEEFVALMARVLAQTYESDDPVGTVECRNDTYDFTISFPALFADLTAALGMATRSSTLWIATSSRQTRTNLLVW